MHSVAEEARRLRVGSGGLLKDDGAGGLPINIQSTSASASTNITISAGATGTVQITNVSNDACVEPKERMRWVVPRAASPWASAVVLMAQQQQMFAVSCW